VPRLGIEAHFCNRGEDRAQPDMGMGKVVAGAWRSRLGGQAELEAPSVQNSIVVRQQRAACTGREADPAQRGVQPRTELRVRIQQRGDEHVAGDTADRIEV